MTQKYVPGMLAAALALFSMPAMAEVTGDQVAESLAAQGYTNIEVAPPADGQIVTRAISAEGVEVSVVYDAETGQVIAAEAAGGDAAPATKAPAVAPESDAGAPAAGGAAADVGMGGSGGAGGDLSGGGETSAQY